MCQVDIVDWLQGLAKGWCFAKWQSFACLQSRIHQLLWALQSVLRSLPQRIWAQFTLIVPHNATGLPLTTPLRPIPLQQDALKLLACPVRFLFHQSKFLVPSLRLKSTILAQEFHSIRHFYSQPALSTRLLSYSYNFQDIWGRSPLHLFGYHRKCKPHNHRFGQHLRLQLLIGPGQSQVCLRPYLKWHGPWLQTYHPHGFRDFLTSSLALHALIALPQPSEQSFSSQLMPCYSSTRALIQPYLKFRSLHPLSTFPARPPGCEMSRN